MADDKVEENHVERTEGREQYVGIEDVLSKEEMDQWQQQLSPDQFQQLLSAAENLQLDLMGAKKSSNESRRATEAGMKGIRKGLEQILSATKDASIHSESSHSDLVSNQVMPPDSKQVTHANSDQTQQKIKALPIPDGDELLTTRQREVAHLLADGMSDEAIADNLVISPHTVKTYRRNIGGKWGKTSGPEKLQEEARKRGYGIGRVVPQSIPKDTL